MSKLSDLARALVQRTADKKIGWELLDDDTIMVVVGRNAVILSKYHGSLDNNYFNIKVKNTEGQTVDEENFEEYFDVYDELEKLMTQAKRDALKADETVDDIMRRLGSL